MSPDFNEKLLLEGVKTLLSFLLLVVGWIFGQRIVAYWDDRKKRNEMDIASAQRFFELYGEFKGIKRLWSTFCVNVRAGREGRDRIKFTPDDDTLRLELLRRSADAESEVEALILKLTAERELDAEQMETLGLFRQAYQKLREAIREDRELEWFSHSREYAFFNDLAAAVARMISFDRNGKRGTRGLRARTEADALRVARENLRAVAKYDSVYFDRRAEKVAAVEKISRGGAAGDARARV